MPQPVKRGQARTRLARRAVVDAARTLFLDRGYAATTVEAISDSADVPIATVYRLFASKLGILRSLLDTSIGGDDQPVAVSERPDVASLFREPDPRKRHFGRHLGAELQRHAVLDRQEVERGCHGADVRRF